MQVSVLFFGMARDLAGVAEERLDIAEGGHLGDLWRQCQARFPRLGEIADSLVTAVNQEIAEGSHPLRDGDEVAFLPPVSGGKGDSRSEISNLRSQISNAESDISDFKFEISKSYSCCLTSQPIPTHRLVQSLKAPEDGAVVTFEGIVRNHSRGKRTLYLEYEAYEPMALAKMEEIAQEAKQKFAIDRIGVIHRLGRLEIGETSVAIIVTSAHRRAAFEACHYAIDRLKQVVPIWKKEYFEDGAVWAEGEKSESRK
ncbi:MAG: molybdopterin converting factor subunit 1 [Terriglobia bacterium]|jgi:molybdopterin synthase catalytic subunit